MKESEFKKSLQVIRDKRQSFCEKMRVVENLQNKNAIKKIAERSTDPSVVCKALVNNNLDDEESLNKIEESWKKSNEKILKNGMVKRYMQGKRTKIQNNK